MRSLVLVLALSACTGDDGDAPVDPHAITACDHIWMQNGYTDCENACVSSGPALQAMGAACVAHTSAGQVNCSKTFVFQGLTGCCSSNKPQVLFGECQ